jgi:hypothetical protein
LAHDIKRKKGKFILIGSNEKKKSQYKVKIQSTPENFLYNGFEYSPLSISFFVTFYTGKMPRQKLQRENESKQGDFILNQHRKK